MKENTFAKNFEPHECVIFVKFTKISTHENKATHITYTFVGVIQSAVTAAMPVD